MLKCATQPLPRPVRPDCDRAVNGTAPSPASRTSSRRKPPPIPSDDAKVGNDHAIGTHGPNNPPPRGCGASMRYLPRRSGSFAGCAVDIIAQCGLGFDIGRNSAPLPLDAPSLVRYINHSRRPAASGTTRRDPSTRRLGDDSLASRHPADARQQDSAAWRDDKASPHPP